MKEILLLYILVAFPIAGHALECFCQYTGDADGLPIDHNECGDNQRCVATKECVAAFAVRNNVATKNFYCDIKSVFNRCGDSDSQDVYHCCNETDLCNEDFIWPDHLTTMSTVGPSTGGQFTSPGNNNSTVLAAAIATPLAVILLVFVTVIVAIAIIRFRKKRVERARRGGDVMEKELSCDLQPEYRLDEFTDPSGSGFGLPHLEQRTIGKSIKLGELIGSGRYGQVLLGDYQGEEVAVKKFLSIDGQSWSREIEVYTTNLLTHDCILRFIASDMISDNGATELWLITQYHPHGSLYDYLNRHELSARTLMQMMVSICSGLAHLHTELYGTINKSAIAHRDIKTRNILVKSDLRCCIADFGLAVMKSKDDKLNVPKNPKQGTKRYMAPEILDESINVNYFESFQHTDIYAVGLVFWEISRRCGGVSGGSALDYEPPFQGLVPPDPSFDDMKRIVVVERRQPSIPPRWHQDELLKNLIQLLRECWSYSSDARPHAVYLKKKLSKLSQEDKLDYEKVIE